LRTADTAVAASAHRGPVATSRHVAFLALVITAVAWFWGPLTTVVSLSLQREQYEHYSHIVIIPLISLFLIYLNRAAVFAHVEGHPRFGVLVMVAAVVASQLPRVFRFDEETTWSVAMLTMVAAVLGAFVLCYGLNAFRKASFGLLLMVCMVPLPPVLLHAVIGFLQRASAEASEVLFALVGVPVFRDGFRFALPGLTIEIAEECSGIRSSIALFIVGLVAAHLFLRSMWAKTTVALVVIPVAIAKNAVRIVVLSLLGIHVDHSFIGASVLHRYSGIPVFMLGLATLAAIIWLLQRSEARLDRRAAMVARS
jgi:exosortase